MKNILVALMLSPFVYSCQKDLSATEFLITHQEEVTSLNEIFEESRSYIAEKRLDKAEKSRVNLFNESSQALKKIEKLESFEDADFLKKETLSLIRFYKDLSSSDHRELIQILRKEKLELIDDVRVSRLNVNFDQMVERQNEKWTKAKMQFERMYKVSVP
jgi:hypothetical protein